MAASCKKHGWFSSAINAKCPMCKAALPKPAPALCRGHKHPNCNYLACIACNKCGKGVPHVAPASSLVERAGERSLDLFHQGRAGDSRLLGQLAAEIEQLTKELGITQEWLEKFQGAASTETLRAERAEARFDEALDALREYGRHLEGCSYPHDEKYGCKCGWLEVENGLN